MSWPFGRFPTVREFIDAAVAQGCEEHIAKGELIGPRGAFKTRYLKAQNSNVLVIMPLDDDEVLLHINMAGYVRRLRLRGFEHLLEMDC